MSSDDPTKPRFCRRCWTWLTNTRNAHIVAACVLGIFVFASLAMLASIHMQQEQKSDKTTTEAIGHFIIEIGMPAAICIALIARISNKKQRTPKLNAIAPIALVGLVALCVLAFYWVWTVCDGIHFEIQVPLPGGGTQTQSKTLEIAEGINRLCTWSAPVFSFLLGLEVWASSK